MTLKLFVFVCFICLIGFIAIVRLFPQTNPSPIATPSLTPLPQTTPASPLHIKHTLNGVPYIVYYAPISNRTLSLLPNFDNPRAAQVVAEEHHCAVASSGGFYTPDRKPVALFRTNSKSYSDVVSTSSLLTGFFYLDRKGNPHIGASYPSDAPTVFQSGPLFTSNMPFPSSTDEEARRIVVIESTTGELFVAAIVQEQYAFSGPYLSDMPAILFSIKEPFTVARALNLDGGSASFYKDESGFALPELVYVGSILCLI